LVAKRIERQVKNKLLGAGRGAWRLLALALELSRLEPQMKLSAAADYAKGSGRGCGGPAQMPRPDFHLEDYYGIAATWTWNSPVSPKTPFRL
jgi:hypothetical protein